MMPKSAIRWLTSWEVGGAGGGGAAGAAQGLPRLSNLIRRPDNMPDHICASWPQDQANEQEPDDWPQRQTMHQILHRFCSVCTARIQEASRFLRHADMNGRGSSMLRVFAHGGKTERA